MTRLIRATAPAAAALALLASAPSALAARDYFLLVPGIPGPVQDAGFVGASVVDQYGWSVRQAAATRTRPAGPRFSEFTVSKRVDSMSPLLMLRAAAGAVIPTVRFAVRSQGTTRSVYHEFCLEGVHVQSVAQEGSATVDDAQETVAFRFDRIVQRYRTFSEDGTTGPFIVGGWDLIAALQYGSFAANCGR